MSLPFKVIRFTNSATGLCSDTIDLDRLIGTPINLITSKYDSAKSLWKITISSPTISYRSSQNVRLPFVLIEVRSCEAAY